MFAAISDMFTNGLLFLGLGVVLTMRLAMKHPDASGGIARGIFSLFFRK